MRTLGRSRDGTDPAKGPTSFSSGNSRLLLLMAKSVPAISVIAGIGMLKADFLVAGFVPPILLALVDDDNVSPVTGVGVGVGVGVGMGCILPELLRRKLRFRSACISKAVKRYRW